MARGSEGRLARSTSPPFAVSSSRSAATRRAEDRSVALATTAARRGLERHVRDGLSEGRQLTAGDRA